METTGQTKICGFDKNAQKSEVIFCQRSKSKKFNTLEQLKCLVITFPSAKMDFNWPLQTRKIRQSFFRQKNIKGRKGQYFKYRFSRLTK